MDRASHCPAHPGQSGHHMLLGSFFILPVCLLSLHSSPRAFPFLCLLLSQYFNRCFWVPPQMFLHKGGDVVCLSSTGLARLWCCLDLQRWGEISAPQSLGCCMLQPEIAENVPDSSGLGGWAKVDGQRSSAWKNSWIEKWESFNPSGKFTCRRAKPMRAVFTRFP